MLLLSPPFSARALERALRWWLEELREAFEPLLRHFRTEPVEIVVKQEGFRVFEGDNPAGDPQDQSRWPDALADLRRLKPNSERVRLTLDCGMVLQQSFIIPAAAVSRAHDILRLRLERTTPFKASDVCFGWFASQKARGSGGVLLQSVIVKRRLLEQLVEPLLTAGFARVEAYVGSAPPIAVRLPRRLTRRYSRLQRVLAVITWTSPAFAGAAVAAGLLLGLARQSAEINTLDSRIAEAQVRASAVRARFDAVRAALARLEGLRRDKSDGRTLLALVEEITRALPDEAWLTELHVDGDVVQFTGFARSAAVLLPLLDRARGIGEAAFAAPVVRDPQQGAERFAISARLKSAAALPDDIRS